MTARPNDIIQTLNAHYIDHVDEMHESAEDARAALECFDAIKKDPIARDHFDALAMADRALHASPDDHDLETLSPFEAQMGELAFLGALDQMLDAESKEDSPSHQQGEKQADTETTPASKGATIIPFPRAKQIVAIAATFAAVILGGVLAQRAFSPTTEFQPRSIDNATTPVSPYADASISLFCATKNDSGEWTFKQGSDFEFDVLQCDQKRGHLKLSYINPYPELKHVAIFGVDDQGKHLWYLPNPAAPSPSVIEVSGKSPKPIGQTIKLSVNHTPGTVRVHALFSKTPIDYHQLRRDVESITPHTLRYHDKLKLPYAHTTSVLMTLNEQKQP